MKRVCALSCLSLLSVAALGQFPSYAVRQLSQTPLSAFPGSPSTAANIFGYVSPSGREYVTLGLRNGTAIVEVTNPSLPQLVAHIPGPVSLWHENTVLGDYCYSISDSTGVGIQIIDLRNVDSGVAPLVATYTGNGMATVHTIQADLQTKRLFANGGTRNFAILDASNPTALTEIGRWTTKYVHDCLVRNHTTGPWAGRQIAYLFCGTAGLYIVDTTDAANIQVKSILNYYPGSANAGKFYSHSASITPDLKYLIVHDELDEVNNISGGSMKTFVIDVEDIENPQVVSTFNNPAGYIDHNSMLVEGFLFLASYKSGLRIYDARTLPGLSESGWIDTHLTSGGGTWEGDWGVYAGFPSGNVAISDINQGLIMVDPSEAVNRGAPFTGGSVNGAVSGTLANLRLPDGKVVTCGYATNVSVFAETTISPRTNLKVTLKARGEGGSLVIKLRNRTTNQLDEVGTMITQPTDTTLAVPNLPTATYVSSTGQVEARVEFVTFTKTGTRTPARIDMLRFDVTP